ncbi:hypothetical protein NG726_29690, partial [Pseudomonas sp. MOB-449]|nr:hypothetical protein [Pseudomonas sp. MOB-449]
FLEPCFPPMHSVQLGPLPSVQLDPDHMLPPEMVECQPIVFGSVTVYSFHLLFDASCVIQNFASQSLQ